MAMFHALASNHSERAVWWLHGARNRSEHAFALESRQLLLSLPNARSYIMYSRPDPGDLLGRDFDAIGHLSVPALDRLGVPREGDFYICGPASFLTGFSTSLKEWGVDPFSHPCPSCCLRSEDHILQPDSSFRRSPFRGLGHLAQGNYSRASPG